MSTLEKIIFAVLVLVVVGGGYWFWRSQQAPEPVAVTSPAPPPPPPQEPEAAIQHPIEQAPVGTPESKPLPALADSDATATEALAGLLAGNRLPDFLVTKSLIRHIVATVDNLPREKVSISLWPVKPAAGALITADTRDGKVIAPENAARYTPYVKWMEALDTQKLAAQYVRLYPLFQEAYRELGYPKGYFNDRLVAVIDHLLATPDVTGATRLEQPKVLYEFSDPVLKSTSAGQHIMLRIGHDNAQKVKAKLRALRKEIAQQIPNG
jgi:hypothetical protein